MNRKFFAAVAVVSTAGLLSACGASRVAGWERETTQVEGNLTEVLAEAEAAWAGRDNADTLRQAIAGYEKAIAINPNQKDVMIRLSRAYYFLSDGYNRANKEEQLRLYDTSASWGERAMATDEDFVKLVKVDEEPVEDAIRVLDASYAGAVYWSAAATGKWARLKGFTTLLSQKNRVKKLMEWVTEQAPDYYYGGPDRYWGAYYSIAPSFAGGDVEVSRKHYDKSLELAPNYLGTKVLMADTLATKIQDREMFENLLNQVIESDPTVIPDVVPEQKVEQEKAREMLAQVNDLFASLPFSLYALLD